VFKYRSEFRPEVKTVIAIFDWCSHHNVEVWHVGAIIMRVKHGLPKKAPPPMSRHMAVTKFGGALCNGWVKGTDVYKDVAKCSQKNKP